MKKFKSFTLVELLVVVAIVILLSIGAVGAMAYTRQNKSVRAVAEAVRQLFSEVRSEALSPSDDMAGVTKLQVRIYPKVCQAANQTKCNSIEVYNVRKVSGVDTPDASPKTTFKIPSGIEIVADNPSAHGNLSCVTSNCNDSTLEYYWYYVYVQAENDGNGKYHDIGSTSVFPALHDLYVKVAGSNETYKVQMDSYSGSATICKVGDVGC